MYRYPCLWPIADAAHCGRPSGCRLEIEPGRERQCPSAPAAALHSRSAAFGKVALARRAEQVAGRLQVMAKDRQLGAGEVGRPAVAGPGLRLELGDSPAVRRDVEVRQLAVEGAAAQTLEAAHLGTRFGQNADG